MKNIRFHYESKSIENATKLFWLDFPLFVGRAIGGISMLSQGPILQKKFNFNPNMDK